jgi:DNA-binding NtrC family response regulator
MRRALIIDDDVHFRNVLRAMLQHVGFDVTEAGEGEQGIRSFLEQPAEVIFCDMFMAGKEGLETIMQMRRVGIQAPIVAMSGGTCGGLMDCLPVAKLLGAATTLPKPFGMEKLTKLLAELDTMPPSNAPVTADLFPN